MGGVIVGHNVLNDNSGYIKMSDYYLIVVMYVCLVISRALSFLTFYPLVFNYGYKINFNEFILFVWGGIRGAVCMVFAMIAASDEALNPKFRNIFIFDMGGIVIMTLLINAPTCGKLIEYLGLSKSASSKDKFFKIFITSMIEDSEK